MKSEEDEMERRVKKFLKRGLTLFELIVLVTVLLAFGTAFGIVYVIAHFINKIW